MAAFRWSVGAWGMAVLFFVGACAPAHSSAVAPEPSQTVAPVQVPEAVYVYVDPALLAANKAELAAGKGPVAALANLRRDADRLLSVDPGSVMDKDVAGPSGDKHDYVSYAPYYWPDPSDPKRPYLSHDGYRNERLVEQGDANYYEQMLQQVHTLGLAYYYTGDEKYAAKAAALTRAWFLNPATRMNPNFDYAQAIPNLMSGRGIGLIENRGLVGALDGLTMIHGSKSWSEADERAMREWVEKFDVWLTTSKNGLAEKNTRNNHGSWYAVQEVGLYLYLGKTAEARAALEGVKERIASQIQPDGKQPLEIVRTDGFTYSVFNLTALTTVAEMGRRNGVDLWHFAQDNHGLKNAIDYMMPFANRQKSWPHNQLHGISPGGMVSIVYLASKAYGDASYQAWLNVQRGGNGGNRTILMGNN